MKYPQSDVTAISSTELIRLAEACLVRIQQRRDRVLHGYALKVQGDYKRSWLHRIFKFPVPSLERIKTAAEVDSSSFLGSLGWGSEEAALRLLTLAKVGGTLLVPLKDLDMIR
jgi:hypothetical protein